MGQIHAAIVLTVAASVVALAVRANTVLGYHWDWSVIPAYLVRTDPDSGAWASNLLLTGFLTTIKLAAGSLLFGTTIGIVVAALRLASRPAFAGPGDEVVFSARGYARYACNALIAGATPVAVPDHDFRADPDALLDAMTPRTRLLMLANPDNPSGAMLTLDEVTAAGRAALSDRAHQDAARAHNDEWLPRLAAALPAGKMQVRPSQARGADPDLDRACRGPAARRDRHSPLLP